MTPLTKLNINHKLFKQKEIVLVLGSSPNILGGAETKFLKKCSLSDSARALHLLPAALTVLLLAFW